MGEKLVKVDGKTRVDPDFPAGFMDVIKIEKSGDTFRLLYDTKGRFVVHRINEEESKYKLARVVRQEFTKKDIPYFATGKIVDFIKFETGNLVMITRGRNAGRVGVLQSIERHQGSFHIGHITDSAGNNFATRLANVFTIGKGNRPRYRFHAARV